MSAAVDALALWLADVHLLSAALLAVVIAALAVLRQPAQRMAIEKAALGGLIALAALCALPGWSVVHLLAEDAPATVAAPSPTSATESFTRPQVVYDPQVDAVFLPVVPTTAAPANAGPPSPAPTTSATAKVLPWTTLSVSAQLAGSAAVIAWLAVGAVVARRVRRDTRPAPIELAEKLQSIAAIPAPQPPALLVSDRVATPLALGLRAPAIVLPARFVEPAAERDEAARDLAAILAHEWAHVAAGDLRTLAVSRLLLVLFWPQPLFWLLRRRLRLDQETLADAAAAEVGGRFDYAQQLLAWSREVGPRGRAPRLAGAVGLWEGPSQLKRRIAALLDEKLTVLRQASRSWRTGTACAALAAAALLSLVTVQRQEAAAQAARSSDAVASPSDDSAPADEPSATAPATGASSPDDFDLSGAAIDVLQSHAMLVMQGYRIFRESSPNVFAGRCVDENGRPLAGVKLSLLRGPFWSSSPEVLGTAMSNDRGEFYFQSVIDTAAEYPDGQIPTTAHPAEPMVHCVAQLLGRTSRLASISQYVVPSAGRSIEFVMSPAVTLRGRVTDERGAPIAGARVIKAAGGGKVAGMWSAETNANGEYEIADLPPFDFAAERRRQIEQDAARAKFVADGDGFLLIGSMAPQFLVTHRDYAFARVQPVELPGVGDVRLQRGGRIAGRVVTPDGRPAANVEVRAYTSVPRQPNDAGIAMFNHGAVSFDNMYFASQRTDAEGRYEFGSLRPGAYDVWAESPGWFNRGLAEVPAVTGNVAHVEDLRFSRGGMVQVTFVDVATGQPIAPEPGLFADVGFLYDNKLSRQEDWPPRAMIGPEGVARVKARPGRARVVVNQPLSTGQAPKWTVVGGENILGAPIVEIREGETVDVRLTVAQAPPVQVVPGNVLYKPVDVGAVRPGSAPGAAGFTASSLDVAQAHSAPASLLDMESTAAGSGDESWRLYPSNTLAVRAQADGRLQNTSGDEPAVAGAATPGAGTTHSATGNTAQLVQADDGASDHPPTTHTSPGRGVVRAVDMADGPTAPAEGHAAPTINAITVRCLDPDGAPRPGMTVVVYRYNFRNNTRKLVGESQTNDAGQVQFTDLVAAERIAQMKEQMAERDFTNAWGDVLQVVAHGPGLATTIFGAQEYEIGTRGYRTDVTIPAGQQLAGRVTAPGGSPVANALVVAGGQAGSPPIEGVNAVRTDADGHYEFTDRPPFDATKARASMNSYFLSASAATSVAAPEPDAPRVGEDREASKIVVTHPDFAVTTVPGGDIPGTVDVTMLPAAAIRGRVVMSDGSAVPADLRVTAMMRNDLALNEGGIGPAAGDWTTATSRQAYTQAEADGRYEFRNLPPGVYDLWVTPPKARAGEQQLMTSGEGELAVPAGDEPIAAPDLVIGPGVHIRGQLIDGTTGQPLKLATGGEATIIGNPVAAPRVQESTPTVAVTADGKFEVDAAPRPFRLFAIIYTNEAPRTTSMPSYQIADSEHSTGQIYQGKHGDAIDATVTVWPSAMIEKRRAELSKAHALAIPGSSAESARQAAEAFTAIHSQYPDDIDALLGRAGAYRMAGDFAAAAADLERVLELRPGNENALLHLSDLLATCSDADVRNGPRAVELATQFFDSMQAHGERGMFARAHSLLAAAHAEAGDFPAAIAAQEEAIRLSRRASGVATWNSGPREAGDELQRRLELYRSNQPLRK